MFRRDFGGKGSIDDALFFMLSMAKESNHNVSFHSAFEEAHNGISGVETVKILYGYLFPQSEVTFWPFYPRVPTDKHSPPAIRQLPQNPRHPNA